MHRLRSAIALAMILCAGASARAADGTRPPWLTDADSVIAFTWDAATCDGTRVGDNVAITLTAIDTLAGQPLARSATVVTHALPYLGDRVVTIDPAAPEWRDAHGKRFLAVVTRSGGALHFYSRPGFSTCGFARIGVIHASPTGIEIAQAERYAACYDGTPAYARLMAVIRDDTVMPAFREQCIRDIRIAIQPPPEKPVAIADQRQAEERLRGLVTYRELPIFLRLIARDELTMVDCDFMTTDDGLAFLATTAAAAAHGGILDPDPVRDAEAHQVLAMNETCLQAWYRQRIAADQARIARIQSFIDHPETATAAAADP